MSDPKVFAAVRATCPKCNGKIRLNQMADALVARPAEKK